MSAEGGEENSKSLVQRDARGRLLPGSKLHTGGSRHRTTRLAYAMFEEQSEEVIQAVITAAKEGDATAMKLVVERIVPPRKSVPIKIDLPPVNCADDAKAAISLVLEAQCSGEIAPDQAEDLLKSIETFIRVCTVSELEAKVNALSSGT